jgi:hypothetical protein
MPEQWPRALIRGALREAGYDAIGTRTLDSAMRFTAAEPGRGPIGLLVVDQQALDDSDSTDTLARLLERIGAPPTVLIAHATSAQPAGPWTRVLRRPMSVADVIAATQAALPLPAGMRRPLD